MRYQGKLLHSGIRQGRLVRQPRYVRVTGRIRATQLGEVKKTIDVLELVQNPCHILAILDEPYFVVHSIHRELEKRAVGAHRVPKTCSEDGVWRAGREHGAIVQLAGRESCLS